MTRTGKELSELCMYKFENTLVSGYTVSSAATARLRRVSA
jgi:hypothetical protein